MKGTLIFDHLNDLIYLKCCPRFVRHVQGLAKVQGLSSSEHCQPFGKGKNALDPNILIQLFSPLVTSQRFMREQFGNPYTSLQCEDGTNIVFQDYMGFLFLRIGVEEISHLKRALGTTIAFVTYLCGPDVSLLKKFPSHSSTLDTLLDSWALLYASDPSFMIEGIASVAVNPQLASSLVSSLKGVVGRVSPQLGPQLHALLFLETKLLSWYSSRSAGNLAPEDLLFLALLCHKTSRNYRKTSSNFSDSSLSASDSSSSEFFHSTEGDWDIVERSLVKYAILLKNSNSADYTPHIVHIGIVQQGFYFVLLSQPPSAPLTALATSGFQQSASFRSAAAAANDRAFFDALESTTKKLGEMLKKHKNFNLKSELISRFDRFRSGFHSYLKNGDGLSLQPSPVIDIYREIFRTYFNEGLLEHDSEPLADVWAQITNDNEDFWGFLRLKTKRNGSGSLLMESRENLSINKYLEEFPGLVHFIHVDRGRHTVLSPLVDFSKDETVKLTQAKIWGMVKFARDHMQQGHFSLMWKDSAFNYAYFLWFEDSRGSPIRPKSPAMPWENYPLPGIMCGDFYKKVIDECFPGIPSSKIRAVELFCIHLGLVTSSCVLEHSKRLATNIWDEYSSRNAATDLL